MNRKQRAIELRQSGYSYKYIKKETGLAISTLSYHLAAIDFYPNDYTLNEKNKAQLMAAKTKNRKTLLSISKAKEFAESSIGKLSDRDILIAGIALYVGEGSKTQNTVRLVNTDPRVIRLFLKWLALMDVPLNNIVARIHGYPSTNMKVAQDYWHKNTKIPVVQFQTPCVDSRKNKDIKRNDTHPHGTLHVTVRAGGNTNCGVFLSRKIKAYMDKVLG